MRIALFCLQYLNFRCFDADLTEREVQEFFQKAYYSFEDYAIVHWIDHLASCTPETLSRDPKTHQDLGKQVETFLSKHGLDSPTAFSTPDNEQLQILKHLDSSLRMDRVAQLAREKKSAASCLDLEAQLHHRRAIYENLVAKMDPDNDTSRLIVSFNGRNNFKCPRLFCDWFYDGFPDEGRRNEHLNKHDRPFRCTIEECLYSKLAYGTETDLKRHLKKSHPTDGNANWTFPLPNRQKKLDIFSAVEAGDLESVRRFVEELGIDANYGRGRRARKGYTAEMTPLCLATIHNQVEIVKYLLGIGVKVNIRVKKQGSERLQTALEIAVTLSHTLIAELLLENGATGLAMLSEAIKTGSLLMVQLLLNRGASQASELGSALDLATLVEQATKNGNTEILKVLLETDLGGIRITYESALMTAVSQGLKDAARLLFENGVSFSSGNEAASSALHLVLSNYSEDVSKEMLDLFSQYGILKGREKEIALQWAAAEGDFRTTRALLKFGPGINETDKDGQTALHLACQGIPQISPIASSAPADCNYSAVVRLLLEKRANAEARNLYGQTPLHLAVQHDVKTTQLLLDFGVELNVRDNMGNTALSYANMVNDQVIGDILRDHGGII